MPQTKAQRLIFALITVVITVPCFVCYCLSIEHNGMSGRVLIHALPLIPIEFAFAYLCEIFIGSPLSLKLALKAVDPSKHSSVIVETAIICSTVCIMATFLYDGFNISNIANISQAPIFINSGIFFKNFLFYWLQKVVVNFPFALFSQLFFIQPLVRTIFNHLFCRNVNKFENKANVNLNGDLQQA